MTGLMIGSAAISVIATIACIVQRKAIHALLYLVVSLLGLAVAMFALGAAFAAAMEAIVYAGAIMVLFIFVVMMLGPESRIPGPSAWFGSSILAAFLLGLLLVALISSPPILVSAHLNAQPASIADLNLNGSGMPHNQSAPQEQVASETGSISNKNQIPPAGDLSDGTDSVGIAVPPKEVGVALFGPFVLCTEIAAFLLIAGFVGAFHLGKDRKKRNEAQIQGSSQ